MRTKAMNMFANSAPLEWERYLWTPILSFQLDRRRAPDKEQFRSQDIDIYYLDMGGEVPDKKSRTTVRSFRTCSLLEKEAKGSAVKLRNKLNKR